MKSYNNDTKLKERFVKEIVNHRKQDMVVQGTYGEQNGKWRGCAVSCSLRSMAIINGEDLQEEYSNHKDYEKLLGIPEWLARLEDTIFEGLPKEDALKWPEQFAKAVPVGVDLESVKWKFCAYLMKENIDRVLALDIADDLKKQVVDAIRQVLAVHEKAIKTGKWDSNAAESAWSAAASAWSAAASAAWSAESAAESAASAAESAWSAAESAWSAAESAAASAARSAESAASAASAAYQKHSKKLLTLLKSA